MTMEDEKTDWKMIRFFLIPPESVRWELHWFDKDGYDNYHPHTGDMSMVEPAPPKNWQPWCYNFVGDYSPCPGVHILVKDEPLEPMCEKCPYRNQGEVRQ